VTRIKICGLRDPETAVETVKAGADMIGLMFAESRRKVTPQECYDIVEAVKAERRIKDVAHFEGPARGEVSGATWFSAWNEAIDDAMFRTRPLIVGVFADQSAHEVNDIADAAGLDLVQLSGSEGFEMAREIERPVIKVVHVADSMTAEDVFEASVPGSAAGLLLDTGTATAYGGTGIAFDWDVAAEVAQRLPLLLAGGLHPGNVAEAVERVAPWGVDVSSGVETDGKKDIEKIRAFIRAVKGARVGG
jgi:phosphoribosylanthranilate isomerase